MVSLAVVQISLVKITDRGYWVSKCYKWLSLIYWTFFSIYFRTLTFFSVANPNIYLGGMLDERKSDIYKLIPKSYLPSTRLYKTPSINDAEAIIKEFDFPIILKPNIGFKGFMVKRIEDMEQLKGALNEYNGKELLIQEYLDESFEYAVMYYYIDENTYGVSSFVEKHLPFVVGNGIQTLRELIENSPNPFLNKTWILKSNHLALDEVIPNKETRLVDHVGNYSRGSKFENLNNKINQDLIESINHFFRNIQGMNFCRLDLKADSLDHLKSGQFKVLEINGAKSEPLHIYDSQTNILQILKSIHQHWLILFKIVRKNINQFEIPSSLEGIRSYYSLKKLVS